MEIDMELVRELGTLIAPFALRAAGGIAILIAGLIACRIARRGAVRLFQLAALDESLVELLASCLY